MQKYTMSQAVLAHNFNSSTQEAERQISVSSRPVWSTDCIPGQVPKVQRYPVSKQSKYSGGVKLLLFADDRIVYLSDPKNSTRRLLQLINVAGYKFTQKYL